jgi:hypothetical protein
MCYASHHELAHCLAHAWLITETWSVTEMGDELVAHARAANRAKATYEREIAAVDRLLPAFRAANPDMQVKAIEAMIEGARERGWISRHTAAVVGKSRKKATEPDPAAS